MTALVWSAKPSSNDDAVLSGSRARWVPSALLFAISLGVAVGVVGNGTGARRLTRSNGNKPIGVESQHIANG